MSNPSGSHTSPPKEICLVFANDERYANLRANDAIHQDLATLSDMTLTDWSHVEKLTLDEVTDSPPSSSLYMKPTYTIFSSALFRSLHRARRDWYHTQGRHEDTPGPPGAALSSLLIRSYGSISLLDSHNRHAFGEALPIRSEFQRALEVLHEGRSKPLRRLSLINVKMRFSLLRALAYGCSVLQLDNVSHKNGSPDERGPTLRTFGEGNRPVKWLWVDEKGLSSLFALRPPTAIEILRFRAGEQVQHISKKLKDDVQYLLNISQDTLQEFRYELFWPTRERDVEVQYISTCLDFSKLINLREIELVVPGVGGDNDGLSTGSPQTIRLERLSGSCWSDPFSPRISHVSSSRRSLLSSTESDSGMSMNMSTYSGVRLPPSFSRRR